VVEVKFCGMTREEDVRAAIELGAAYVGTVMTESKRRVTPDRAKELFSVLGGTRVRSVGVFGDEPIEDVLDAARLAGCDVVQLHGLEHRPADADRLRTELDVDVWHVVRVGPDGVAAADRDGVGGADGVLLDTFALSTLGGTGQPFDWEAVAGDVRDLRFGRCLIVAGGLRPENVRGAIDRLAPDVVDVSSGVEAAPGIKDQGKMAAFMTAVRQSVQ
jgi:phosphoribosylanthranilate isomerase